MVVQRWCRVQNASRLTCNFNRLKNGSEVQILQPPRVRSKRWVKVRNLNMAGLDALRMCKKMICTSNVAGKGWDRMLLITTDLSLDHQEEASELQRLACISTLLQDCLIGLV